MLGESTRPGTAAPGQRSGAVRYPGEIVHPPRWSSSPSRCPGRSSAVDRARPYSRESCARALSIASRSRTLRVAEKHNASIAPHGGVAPWLPHGQPSQGQPFKTVGGKGHFLEGDDLQDLVLPHYLPNRHTICSGPRRPAARGPRPGAVAWCHPEQLDLRLPRSLKILSARATCAR